MRTASANSISEKVERGEIVCKKCGKQAVEVIGWSFLGGGDSFCPMHTPLSVVMPEVLLRDEKIQALTDAITNYLASMRETHATRHVLFQLLDRDHHEQP